jgi:hypothetical protein
VRIVVKHFLALGVISLGAVAGTADAAEVRTAGGSKSELVLDQTAAGSPHSVSGGYAIADVVDDRLGPDNVTKKHVANVKYEDITLECGAGMSKAFWAWIQDSLNKKSPRRNGAVDFLTFDNKQASRLTYTGAFVSQVTFPALDGSSKDAAFVGVSLAPDVIRRVAGSGAAVAPRDGSKQKQWLASNFKLDLAGLDTTRVARIEPLTIKQKVAASAIGVVREPTRQPTNLEIPNLVVWVSEAGAADWYAWHQSFLVDGQHTDDKEKSGSISYLLPDMKTPYMKLLLKHVGLVKLTPDKVESGSEAIRRVRVEMYVEDVSLEVDPGAGF